MFTSNQTQTVDEVDGDRELFAMAWRSLGTAEAVAAFLRKPAGEVERLAKRYSLGPPVADEETATELHSWTISDRRVEELNALIAGRTR